MNTEAPHEGEPMAEASPEFWLQQARHMRKLAREIVDEQAQRELIRLAEEYENRAAAATNNGERP